MRVTRRNTTMLFAMVSSVRTCGAFLLQKGSFRPSTSSLPVASFSPLSQELSSKSTPMQSLVICGPSGVGKGTIISRFMASNNSKPSSDTTLPKFVFSVSHTTRQPRTGEIDGVHYHFCSKDFMQHKIEQGGFFIEHAQVHGNLYGTSFQSIYDASSSDKKQQCLLDIDVEGVKSIKNFQLVQKLQQSQSSDKRSSQTTVLQSLPELQAQFIFIAPPSIDVLHERLTGRGSETPESLQRRFQNAKAEIEYGTKPGNFDAIIVNDDLDTACEEFDATVRNIYSC